MRVLPFGHILNIDVDSISIENKRLSQKIWIFNYIVDSLYVILSLNFFIK